VKTIDGKCNINSELKDSNIFFKNCLNKESVDICNECFYNDQCKGNQKKEN